MWINEFKLALAVVLCLVVLLGLWPTSRVCRRSGVSSWWCLLVLVPLVNVIAVYLYAIRHRES